MGIKKFLIKTYQAIDDFIFGNVFLSALLLGAIIFFFWWVFMPEHKLTFVVCMILLLSQYIPIPKIIIGNKRISKIISKMKKFLTIVLAIFLGYALLFSIIGSFILGWKIWLIIFGIGLILLVLFPE